MGQTVVVCESTRLRQILSNGLHDSDFPSARSFQSLTTADLCRSPATPFEVHGVLRVGVVLGSKHIFSLRPSARKFISKAVMKVKEML